MSGNLNEQTENLGENIASQQAEAARQLQNQQANGLDEMSLKQQNEKLQQLQQIAEAKKIQAAQLEENVQQKWKDAEQKVDNEIEKTKAGLKEIGVKRQGLMQNELSKPDTNVAVTGLAAAGSVLGVSAIAKHLGDAAGAAKGTIENMAKNILSDDKFDVGKEINTIFEKTDISSKDKSNLATKMLNVINKDSAALVDKEALIGRLQKDLEDGDLSKEAKETVSKELNNIVGKMFGGKEEEINKAVDKAFKQGGGFLKEGTIPDNMKEDAKSIKEYFNTFPEKRKIFTETGDHVQDLTGAYKEKMEENFFGKTAVKVVDFYKDNKEKHAANVPDAVILGGIAVGTGAIVAGAHYLLTAGEREEKEAAQNTVDKYNEAAIAGQQHLLELANAKKEIKGRFTQLHNDRESEPAVAVGGGRGAV